MRRFRLIAAAFALLTAAPALASAEEAVPAPTATVLMSPLALPVVVDGRLINYVFVTIRIGLSAKADPIRLRAMEPFFRDALVREGYRNPFVRQDDYTALDDDRLKATLLRDANMLAGAGSVSSAQIIREQTQHSDGLPKPKVRRLGH